MALTQNFKATMMYTTMPVTVAQSVPSRNGAGGLLQVAAQPQSGGDAGECREDEGEHLDERIPLYGAAVRR